MLMSESCAELALLLTWALWESWPWGHENRRADPAPTQLRCLGERAPHIAGVLGEPAQCECGKAGPTAHLPGAGVDVGEKASSPLVLHHLQQAGGDLALGSRELESSSWPSPVAALKSVGPAPLWAAR